MVSTGGIPGAREAGSIRIPFCTPTSEGCNGDTAEGGYFVHHFHLGAISGRKYSFAVALVSVPGALHAQNE